MSTAELAGTDFKVTIILGFDTIGNINLYFNQMQSEKMNVSIVTQNTGLISDKDRAKKEEEHLAHKDLLKIPRR